MGGGGGGEQGQPGLLLGIRGGVSRHNVSRLRADPELAGEAQEQKP